MDKMIFSDFGKKITGESGILQLMDDLGKPLPPGIPSYRLGGGNPARIPEIEAIYRKRMTQIMETGDDYERLIGCYDSPQGRMEFINGVASYLSAKYGWKIGPENIAVTNGSQSACFYLFNLFSGTFTDQNGNKKKKSIVMPLVPEYIGYADQGIEKNSFVGIPAGFTVDSDHTFKYHIDFPCLEKYLASHDDAGALCVSRPTNPTGNVLTDEEISRLSGIAKQYDIPLIIDNAYGLPWPDIIFTENAEPYWDENVILSMSLSKIGLPSLRTGIIIADSRIVTALSNMNAIAALASGSCGQALAGKLIKTGTLVEAARKYVRPYYYEKSRKTIECINRCFAGTEYYVHKSEGAIFLWLYMPSLKITTKELYAKLKERGVIIVPGEYFFFGNAPDGSLPAVEDHPHYSKCIRMNYAGPEDEVMKGIEIISEVYKASM